MNIVTKFNHGSSSVELYWLTSKCVAQFVPNNSIDVIVTSPPYNLKKNYEEYHDDLPRDEYLDWLKECAVAFRDCLNSEGSFFFNIGGKPSDPWLPLEAAAMFDGIFETQNIIIWVKSVCIEDRTFGHFKPINSERFLNDCFEYVFHFTKSKQVPLDRLAVGVPYTDKSNIARWNIISDVRCRGNVWWIPYETVTSEKEYPCSFPVQLPEMCIKLHGVDRCRTVLDPFCGSGSTGVAAVSLGKDFKGFDINPNYLELTMRRIQSDNQD